MARKSMNKCNEIGLHSVKLRIWYMDTTSPRIGLARRYRVVLLELQARLGITLRRSTFFHFPMAARVVPRGSSARAVGISVGYATGMQRAGCIRRGRPASTPVVRHSLNFILSPTVLQIKGVFKTLSRCCFTRLLK